MKPRRQYPEEILSPHYLQGQRQSVPSHTNAYPAHCKFLSYTYFYLNLHLLEI